MDYTIYNDITKGVMFSEVIELFEDVLEHPEKSCNEYLCWMIYVFFNNGICFSCMVNDCEPEEEVEYLKLLRHYGPENIDFIGIIKHPCSVVCTNNEKITSESWKNFYDNFDCCDYFEHNFITENNVYINTEVDRSEFHLDRFLW